jgi:hypothetical protein
LLSSLLERNPLQRLGYRGASEIKGHPFFRDVDWKAIEKRQVVVPVRDERGRREDTVGLEVRVLLVRLAIKILTTLRKIIGSIDWPTLALIANPLLIIEYTLLIYQIGNGKQQSNYPSLFCFVVF